MEQMLESPTTHVLKFNGFVSICSGKFNGFLTSRYCLVRDKWFMRKIVFYGNIFENRFYVTFFIIWCKINYFL